jgi:amino acid transporter
MVNADASYGNRHLKTDHWKRGLGRWDLLGITINSTIGAGILGLPGKVYALLGPYSVLACLAGGALMGLVACCYAEASSRVPGTGGTILYARAAFGPRAGFLAGWLAIVTRLLAFASICNLVVSYASGLVPAIAEPAWRVVAITVLSWGLGGVIYAGVSLSALANGGFTVAKLLLLAGFVVVGLGWLWPLHPRAWPPLPPAGNWAPGIVLLLFGLIGMDAAVVNGQEMRNPRRAVPFGLGVGMLIVVSIYSAILLVCAGVVPNLAHSTRPLFDGAVAMHGPWAGVLVVVGAVISMAGTLFTILFVGPRLVFALAAEGQMPAGLAFVSPRRGTPTQAVLVHTALAWLLAVTSSFLGALTASTLTRLMLYALTAMSLVVLRRRGLSAQPHPLLLPGGLAMALASAFLCIWLMVQADRAAWTSALCCLALGAVVFVSTARRGALAQ